MYCFLKRLQIFCSFYFIFRTLENKAGIYVTCNTLPHFGDEQANMEKRMSVYHTTSLPVLVPDAPKWIEDNAMACLVWMANEINRNVHLLDTNERFYEKEFNAPANAFLKSGFPESEMTKLRQLTSTDINEINVHQREEQDDDELNDIFKCSGKYWLCLCFTLT